MVVAGNSPDFIESKCTLSVLNETGKTAIMLKILDIFAG